MQATRGGGDGGVAFTCAPSIVASPSAVYIERVVCPAADIMDVATETLEATPEALARAAAVLRAGELVAIPTETVYGLGADASNPEAVRRIFRAKGRPSDHPLIVHLASATELPRWARRVPRAARQLAERFWPGPLTLILQRMPQVPDAVTGGLDTVALRVPGHPLALELLRRFGSGVAAPSANRFGRVSPTTAEHVRDELEGRVALILDGGRCTVGIESTIVDVSGDHPTLLRPGGVSREALERVVQRPVNVGKPSERVRSPGLLPSHYAPRARVVIANAADLEVEVACLQRGGARVGVLAPSSVFPLPDHPARTPTQPPQGSVERDAPRPSPVCTDAAVWLALPDEPAEAAPLLYDRLREADRMSLDVVVAVAPATRGIGAAIADRLERAAAPRPPEAT